MLWNIYCLHLLSCSYHSFNHYYYCYTTTHTSLILLLWPLLLIVLLLLCHQYFKHSASVLKDTLDCSGIRVRINKRLWIRDEERQINKKSMYLCPLMTSEQRQWWSVALVMHVKPVTHQTTRGASGRQNVPTQRFSFSMHRGERKHRGWRGQTQTQTHTAALRPWKSADMSATTRRRSVCGAAERFSCDNAGNDTPHPRVARGQHRAHKQRFIHFIHAKRIGKYNYSTEKTILLIHGQKMHRRASF